jgi:L,D-peptidoglycan transpeptidase YkuD (ErfK/YbiS/YcfS/YnhG family)
MSDEGYDTHPMSSYMSPQGYGNNQQPLSSRMDLNQSQDNQAFYNNSIDKPFNGRIKFEIFIF